MAEEEKNNTTPQESAPKGSKSDVEQNKGIAALAYIWILFIIPLMKKDSDYAKYHGKQGLVFFICATLVGFISRVPVIGWILDILIFILFIIGLINALGGKKQPLPVIGKFAESFNI